MRPQIISTALFIIKFRLKQSAQNGQSRFSFLWLFMLPEFSHNLSDPFRGFSVRWISRTLETRDDIRSCFGEMTLPVMSTLRDTGYITKSDSQSHSQTRYWKFSSPTKAAKRWSVGRHVGHKSKVKWFRDGLAPSRSRSMLVAPV